MKERGDLTGPPAGYDGHEIEIVAWDGWRLRSEDVRLTVSRDILAVCRVASLRQKTARGRTLVSAWIIECS